MKQDDKNCKILIPFLSPVLPTRLQVCFIFLLFKVDDGSYDIFEECTAPVRIGTREIEFMLWDLSGNSHEFYHAICELLIEEIRGSIFCNVRPETRKKPKFLLTDVSSLKVIYFYCYCIVLFRFHVCPRLWIKQDSLGGAI